MFMTCVEIDRRHPSARQALADCSDMHRNIMRLFASSTAPVRRCEERVLYRIVEQRSTIQLYLTSQQAPDLSQARWLLAERQRQREMRPLLDGFAAGQVFSFDLLTHPSKKVRGEGKNSARRFLKTAEERFAWLAHQGEKYGFHLLGVHEEEPYDIHGKRSTGRMTLRVVRMIGQLQITEADAFRTAYQNGIGPEKAYGLGMLLLTRG